MPKLKKEAKKKATKKVEEPEPEVLAPELPKQEVVAPAREDVIVEIGGKKYKKITTDFPDRTTRLELVE